MKERRVQTVLETANVMRETCVGWDRSVTMTVREKVEELTEQPEALARNVIRR